MIFLRKLAKTAAMLLSTIGSLSLVMSASAEQMSAPTSEGVIEEQVVLGRF